MTAAIQTWQRGDYAISTDPARFDLARAHGYIASSYWARDIPFAVFAKAVAGSLCFGIYHGVQQIGLARMISDGATFGYLADVFIDPAHRGQGLSKWLMDCILAHPDLQGLRRLMLATADAHGLYAQFDFTPLNAPERFMQRHNPDIYKKPT
jgi:GNAT superfamily N-acetyltransferase